MKNPTIKFRRFPKWTVLLLTFAAILSVSSCKKSGDDNGSNSSSRAKILVAGKWTLKETHIRQKDGSWQLQPTSPFVTTLEFRDDKTVIVYSTGSTSVQGWLLSGDNNQLTLTQASGSGKTYDIAQLTSYVLQIIPAGYHPDDYMHRRDTFSR